MFDSYLIEMNESVLCTLLMGLSLLVILVLYRNMRYLTKKSSRDINVKVNTSENDERTNEESDKASLGYSAGDKLSDNNELPEPIYFRDSAIVSNDPTTDSIVISSNKVQGAVQPDIDFKLAKTCVQGLSHKKMTPQVPCQDSGRAGILSNGFHVLIASDGAGSSNLSHVASDFCVNTLYSYLEVYDFSKFHNKPIHSENYKDLWHESTKQLFGKVRSALISFAEDENIELSELNCTLILVIKTGWGFLSANIGDGRSGYSDGTPHSLTVPFMTFTVGATYFLIKEDWKDIMRSYVSVVESPESIKYFFTCTDGCQDFVIDNSEKGSKNGIYDNVLGDNAFYDKNVPYEPFFDGLILSLSEATSFEDRNTRLRQLVDQGLYSLNGETKELKSISNPLLDDDKTLIIYFRMFSLNQ